MQTNKTKHILKTKNKALYTIKITRYILYAL